MKFNLFHWQKEEKVKHLNLKLETPKHAQYAAKYSIEIGSLEDLVKLSKEFDIMFTGDTILLDDKGGRFKQR